MKKGLLKKKIKIKNYYLKDSATITYGFTHIKKRGLLLTTQNSFFIATLVTLVACICTTLILRYTFHFIVILNILFIATILLKSYLTFKTIKISKSNANYKYMQENDLPLYSVILPIYKESNVLQQLINNISKINYPKEKLQALLVIEDDDLITINALRKIRLPSHFRIVYVPFDEPRTKGRACNYALNYVKGKYVTIYDAEDCPDPNQIRKVLYKFKNSHPNVACIQSRLNFYNIYENFFSRMIALEYFIQFNYIIPNMLELNLPAPLGGSSNHFNTKILKKLQGWDPYIVAEDAEITYRLAKEGYKIGYCESYTMEEAPISLKVWFNQRARWIKGHIMTYITHFKNCFTSPNGKFLLSLNFNMGLLPLLQLFIPIGFVVTFLSLYQLINLSDTHLKFITILSFFSSLLGIFFNISAICFVYKQNKLKNFTSFLLFPFYLILQSFAAYYALYQLITSPYRWCKTPHGISSLKSNANKDF